MISIRQRLMFGFGCLLAVIVLIGMLTMSQINDLGHAIDKILRENYRSVVACQDMKESLERIDNGVLNILSGNKSEGKRLVEEYTLQFRSALNVELGNITLPKELEKSQRIKTLFEEYLRAIPNVALTTKPLQILQSEYISILQPILHEIKSLAQEILIMNQKSMSDANNSARGLAKTAHLHMSVAIIIAFFLAVLFSNLAHRWILDPINRLIESTIDIRRGNLELVLETGSKDEIGQLSESFNEMAAALRQVREEDKINLIRTRRATEDVFKALPAAIAVLDMDGRVDVSTDTANRYFGLKPGVLAGNLGYEWLTALTRRAIDENRIVEHDPEIASIQQFIDNKEYFFRPMAVPISVGPEHRNPSGVALILKDVTQLHEQQELKRGVVATVSHQLKTPMTSLRMAIHLLLEERVGSINEKQTELLVAAREDSERLVGIIDDLLSLNRMESGKTNLVLRSVAPQMLVSDAIEPFLIEAKDKCVTFINAVSDTLPDVMADSDKIFHVFANLFSNAIRFSNPGGTITVRATQESDYMRFLVEDTGKGIPANHMQHLFEQFYRVPGQDEKSGVGLGLSIVKEIVQVHGGAVRAESEFNKGSIFSFTLPLEKLS